MRQQALKQGVKTLNAAPQSLFSFMNTQIFLFTCTLHRRLSKKAMNVFIFLRFWGWGWFRVGGSVWFLFGFGFFGGGHPLFY